jgi:RNA-directed DNA polymerase
MDLIRDISREFSLSKADVEVLVNTAPQRYKVYYIDKRRGKGKRRIAQPSYELKKVQRYCISVLSEWCLVHDAAAAYVPGKSIKLNAERHKDSRFLLKIDFKNFFNSFVPDDFIYYMKSHCPKVDPKFYPVLVNIFYSSKATASKMLSLSVGAPSSPMLTNYMMYDFDVLLSNYSRDNGVTYTRYSDDLVFSAKDPEALVHMEGEVRKVISTIPSPALFINKEKTVYASMKGRRVVTGLVLTNSKAISIGRDRKRLLSSMLHKYSLGQLSGEQIVYLRGYLSYVNDVEPLFVQKIFKKYGLMRVE